MSINRTLWFGAGALGLLAMFASDPIGPEADASVDALAVAEWLRERPREIHILDLRSDSAFAAFHLPRARHVGATPIVEAVEELEAGESVVVYAADRAGAVQGWRTLRSAGIESAYYLEGGVDRWLDQIVSPVLSPDASDAARISWERQSDLSRYFGGFPRVAERESDDGSSAQKIERARRRGCAF